MQNDDAAVMTPRRRPWGPTPCRLGSTPTPGDPGHRSGPPPTTSPSRRSLATLLGRPIAGPTAQTRPRRDGGNARHVLQPKLIVVSGPQKARAGRGTVRVLLASQLRGLACLFVGSEAASRGRAVPHCAATSSDGCLGAWGRERCVEHGAGGRAGKGAHQAGQRRFYTPSKRRDSSPTIAQHAARIAAAPLHWRCPRPPDA
ncbi:hypothetical protein BV25DRAFT_601112 [Artomyces pyxidatus]|uniref:Uncharacterized protein n=1 Tax=Artomyces pyxidatus TaxID=48021 RepID=A0ACB8T3N7_9AGAM|nr:hypothetical protein BV25DRAFT_601112 [Artomyces pyxidatus]